MSDSSQSSAGTRILWWSDTYWPHIGGIELLGAHLLPRLIERGFEVVVLTSQRGQTLPNQEVHDNVSIRRLPLHEALQANRTDLWAHVIAGIRQLKSELRPDVVHLNFPSPSCIFHLLTEKAWRAPTLVAIRTAFPPQARASDTLTHRMLGSSAWVTANSQAMLRDAWSIAPEIRERSSVIYNGLPTLQCEPSPLLFNPPVIVCVARLVEKKGIDIALRAFAIVKQRIPGVRMIVAGDGPEAAKLHALAHEIGVTDSVEFKGWVEPAAIAGVIDCATLVLVPSRSTEPFGIVAVEAMQMARPVIVTDQGGLPEVVDDGKTGFVVAADDSDALARVAILILENPTLAQRLGEAGKRRAETCFSIDRYTDEHEALYRRLAKRSVRKE